MCVSIYNPLFLALPHLHTKRHHINQNDDSCLKGHFYRTSRSVFVFVMVNVQRGAALSGAFLYIKIVKATVEFVIFVILCLN